MSYIEDCADYLADQDSDYTVGKNVFIGEQPSRIDRVEVVTLYETGGRQPEPYYRHDKPNLQIYIRAKEYDTGESMARAMMTVFHRIQNVELQSGGTYCYYMLAMTSPQHLGLDDNGNHEFSLNFISHIR